MKTLQPIPAPASPSTTSTTAGMFERRDGRSTPRDRSARIMIAAPFSVQPKLTVNKPGDPFEQEADRVAEHVMRSAQDEQGLNISSRYGDDSEAQRSTHDPYSKEEGILSNEERPVQTKEYTGSSADHVSGSTAVLSSFRSGGEPLSSPLRSFVEPRFGHDFSRVRVHTGSRASRAAVGINARAFTMGNNIVFRDGEYAPNTGAGMKLLAHELTHVVQQGSALPLRSGPRERATREDGNQARKTPSIDRTGDDAPEKEKIQRVQWSPNTSTGATACPWGNSICGSVLQGHTDAGTAIDIWRPDDGTTYWCHGYTFGGSTATGGPYSIWGSNVEQVLEDDAWRQVDSCVTANGDILVFYNAQGQVAHTGIIRDSVMTTAGHINETASTLESKWGTQALSTLSWERNIIRYGSYRCYSKSPAQGPCAAPGTHELT